MPEEYKGILKIIFGIYTRCQQTDILKYDKFECQKTKFECQKTKFES